MFGLRALALCFAGLSAWPQAPESWLLVVDLWGNPAYLPLTFTRDQGRIRGELDGDPVQGWTRGDVVELTATTAKGNVTTYHGTFRGELLSGEADYPDSNHPSVRVKHPFEARKLPAPSPGGPETITYAPTVFSNEFSPHKAPVRIIRPGDTVRTTTLDSGGVDAQGVTRALFGNPQTGPFYIASAVPGDTLAIHLKSLRLNRDYADSLDTIVARALGPSLASKAGDLGRNVRWKLDRKRGVATPEAPTGRLKGFEVPVRPMLGCLAVAPGFGSAPVSTGDAGRFGGNMDCNEIVEGATVYLPVLQPGALLYLGDGHALQGDGETTQYALETSLDVEFTVQVLKGRTISMPRVESPTRILTLGQAGSLDEALRSATTGMIQWLQQDYGLTLSECAQVLGAAVQYSVPNLAGRSVGVAAKLDKAVLGTLGGRGRD